MKKAIVIVLILLVLLGGGYFLLPSTINWEKYTQEVSATVKAATGRNLVIQGKPVFTLRPVPILKLGRITMTNASGAATPNMLVAASAEVQFDAGAIFKRQIKIKKVTLNSPQFFLENLQDGRSNWNFGILQKESFGNSLGFESVLIKNGTAVVRSDKYSPPQNWMNLNAELFADSLRGPYFFEGNVSALSTTFGFSAKIEKVEGDRPPEFNVRITNAPSETSLTFAGAYGAKGGDKNILSGNVTFEMRKAQQAFKILYPENKLPADLFMPFVGNFSFTSNGPARSIEMEDILFQYGASSATGKLFVQKISPEEIAAAEEAKLKEEFADDADILLVDPNNPDEAVSLSDLSSEVMKVSENALPKVVRGSFIFSKFEAEPWVKNIGSLTSFISEIGNFQKTKDTYNLDLTFDTVDYNKDVIRQLKAGVVNDKTGLKFSQISGSLPGNATFSSEAVLRADKVNPLFSGNISVDADNMAALMRWLNVVIPDEVPPNLLRNFRGKTEFKIAKNGIILEKTDLTLDQMTAAGGMSLRFGTRKAGAIVAKVNDLNIDSYFPEMRKTQVALREETLKVPQGLAEKVKKLFIKLAFLNDFDGTLKLDAETMTWADIKADKVLADLSVVRGNMQIRNLSVEEILKSSFDLKGGMTGFGSVPVFKDLEIGFNSKQLMNVLQFTGTTLNKELLRSDLLYLRAKVSGGTDAFELNMNADFGHIAFTAAGNVRQSAVGLGYDLVTTIKQDNFRNFARLFTEKYRPALANPGPFAFKGHLIKDERQFQALDVAASIGSNAVTGSFRIDFTKKVPAFTAELNADSIAPFGALPRINFLDPALVSVTQTAAPEEPAEDEPFFSLFGEKVVFPRTNLDFSFLGNYTAEVQLKAKTLILDRLELSQVDSILKLSQNSVNVDLRYAVWKKANIVSMSRIDIVDGLPTLQIRFRASNPNAGARAFGSSASDFVFGGFSFDVNAQGSGRTTSDIVESAKGKGNIAFTKVILSNFDYNLAAKDLFSQASTAKEDFEKATLSGKTDIDEMSSPFSLEKGTISFAPVAMVYAGKKEEKSSFSYNFLTREINAVLSVDFLNKDSPLGDVPNFEKRLSGLVDSPSISNNAEAVYNAVNQIKAIETEKEKEEMEKQKQVFLARQAEQKDEIKDQLLALEQKLLLSIEDLQKKIDGAENYARRVYRVQTYFVLLEKDMEAMKQELDALRQIIQKGSFNQGTVKEQEEKIKKLTTDKETAIEKNYSVALTVGAKGLVIDSSRQTNELLMQLAKMKAANKDLDAEISPVLESVIRQMDQLKTLEQQAEKTEDMTELTLLVAQAEAIYEKAFADFTVVNDMVRAKQEKIEAEQARIREEQEEKRRLEIEAQKAADAAAEAERQRKAEEEKERQSTIIRRDGVQIQSQQRDVSQPALRLIPQDNSVQPQPQPSQDQQQPAGGIIRRR